MTRYTNVGIKRTFVQAGFEGEHHASTSTEEVTGGAPTASKHSRKQRKSENTSDQRRDQIDEGRDEQGDNRDPTKTRSKDDSERKKSGKGKGASKKVNAQGYLKRKSHKDDKGQTLSEQRRLRRIAERNADTVCYACREKGHAARDCPSAIRQDNALDEEQVALGRKAVPLTGICYRCGSTKHSLSRCFKPEDPLDPLPFASCFVCSGRGHLASKCPQNKAKGVYPNGGSCKLCGETSHLARDCELRKQEKLQGTVVLGTGDSAGADEDDFHSLKRTNAQIDKEERIALKVSKKLAKGGPSEDTKQLLKQAKKVIVF